MIYSDNTMESKFNPYFLETLSEEEQQEYEIECARQLEVLTRATEEPTTILFYIGKFDMDDVDGSESY